MLVPAEMGNMISALSKIKIPTYLSGMARGLFGANCFYQLRHHRRANLKKADFVILAGAVCDFRLSYGRDLPKNATIVTINRSYDQATKNAGVFWSPTLTVVGDVSRFIAELGNHIEKNHYHPSWLFSLREKEMQTEMHNKTKSMMPLEEHLNPLHVLMKLDEALPDNAFLVLDGGDFVGSASRILRPRGPLTWLDPGPFGTLGAGAGFAIGAQVTRPECQVWIIYGDGSCGYSIVEFDTYVRHHLPIIALVGNDAGWSQIEREQLPMFGTAVACTLKHSDYHRVVLGFGAEGLVTCCRGAMPLSMMRLAMTYHSEGKPVLINAVIGKTQFRDGSIAV